MVLQGVEERNASLRGNLEVVAKIALLTKHQENQRGFTLNRDWLALNKWYPKTVNARFDEISSTWKMSRPQSFGRSRSWKTTPSMSCWLALKVFEFTSASSESLSCVRATPNFGIDDDPVMLLAWLNSFRRPGMRDMASLASVRRTIKKRINNAFKYNNQFIYRTLRPWSRCGTGACDGGTCRCGATSRCRHRRRCRCCCCRVWPGLIWIPRCCWRFVELAP